jgi:hypothetical protein
MLDALDADWAIRESEGAGDMRHLRESLWVKYLPPMHSRSADARRVLRAVFAKGETRDLGEFKEVFRNETKERRHDDAQSLKRVKVDVDQDIYGDYLDDDDENLLVDVPSSPPAHMQGDENLADVTVNGSEMFGGMESLLLRHRFMTSVSAEFLPTIRLC